ncbi:hypothetical protein HWV62_34523 [Athelia sp. TMB]|nr:hypothetical protein HWV62_34523 [Athelia sp. TMB]
MDVSSEQDSHPDRSVGPSADKGKARAHDEDDDDSSISPPGYTEDSDLMLALCSYEAEHPDQLSLRPGDLVRLLKRNPNGWFTMRQLRNDRVGIVPGKIFSAYNPSANQFGNEPDTVNNIERLYNREVGNGDSVSIAHNPDFKPPLPSPDDTRLPRDTPPAIDPEALNQINAPPCLPTHGASASNEERVDMLGEELSNESSVWSVYVSTAADYDTEMIDGWNKNLDVLLLFASLFSAVVTSFVIQSATLLQNDYGQVNALLTAHILSSAFMAMVHPECPYTTPATGYFRSRVAPYLHFFRPIKEKCTPTSDDLLVTRAMMWLATARSSASASAALQSMAGLRRGFIGYDSSQAANITKLALERLRNCFISDWRYQDSTSYTCRNEASLAHASSYARTLMHFVDDPRNPRPSDFAAILADPALPVFLQILGTSANPDYALLGLCDHQRLLHCQEVARFHSVRNRDGSYDSQQAGEVIRARPAVENMIKIIHLLGKYLDGSIFLHGLAIEIAIETLGFAPLAWICAISGNEDISIEDMLLPLLRIRKATPQGTTGIRLALASTFSILAAVHQSEKLPDPADDLSLKFEIALATANAIRHDHNLAEARSILLRSLSYFLRNHVGSSGAINLLYKELCRECDADVSTQSPDFSDKVAVQSLLPLLLVPLLGHEEKEDIVTRIHALALSAAPGFDIQTNSIMFNITPRDPFPLDAVNTLVTVLYRNKELTPSWLRFVSTVLYIITQCTVHRQKLIAEAPVTLMELIRDSTSIEVASDLFWTFTALLQQAARNSDSTTMHNLASAGALGTLENYRARVGLTLADVVAWVEILPSLPAVSTEAMSRTELIQSLCVGVETQAEEDAQVTHSIREPLLQFSAGSMSISASASPREPESSGLLSGVMSDGSIAHPGPMIRLPSYYQSSTTAPPVYQQLAAGSPATSLPTYYSPSAGSPIPSLPGYQSATGSPMPTVPNYYRRTATTSTIASLPSYRPPMSSSPLASISSYRAPMTSSPLASISSYQVPNTSSPMTSSTVHRSVQTPFPTGHLSPIMSSGRSISSSSQEPVPSPHSRQNLLDSNNQAVNYGYQPVSPTHSIISMV